MIRKNDLKLQKVNVKHASWQMVLSELLQWFGLFQVEQVLFLWTVVHICIIHVLQAITTPSHCLAVYYQLSPTHWTFKPNWTICYIWKTLKILKCFQLLKDEGLHSLNNFSDLQQSFKICLPKVVVYQKQWIWDCANYSPKVLSFLAEEWLVISREVPAWTKKSGLNI